jgi:hypothetical protein
LLTLEAYTPFILGVILQIGAAVGVAVTAPSGADEAAQATRAERTKDIDASQSIASLVTIIGAAVLAPGVPAVVRGLVGLLGVALTPLVPWLLKRWRAGTYERWTAWILTPLNYFMIAFNLLACLAIWLWPSITIAHSNPETSTVTTTSTTAPHSTH